MAALDYKALAQYTIAGEAEKREITKITAQYPDFSVEDAYKVQEELVKIKLAEGHRIIGPKMGLTSYPKMKQMNVEEPIYGYIFDYMVSDNGQISVSNHIHPKVEAEIAFIMGQDLEGPGITGAQALAATEYVIPALEIIDSRYQNFEFTLPDVIADNASSSGVILGSAMRKPGDLELDLVGVTLSVNGELKELGAGAAVLNHPANAIAMLANMLARKGDKVKAGDVILAGAITGAVAFKVGDTISAKLDGFGEIGFKAVE